MEGGAAVGGRGRRGGVRGCGFESVGNVRSAWDWMWWVGEGDEADGADGEGFGGALFALDYGAVRGLDFGVRNGVHGCVDDLGRLVGSWWGRG